MVRSGEINRLAKGIYLKASNDPILGTLTPSLETIAQAIAKKDHMRIRQTGA